MNFQVIGRPPSKEEVRKHFFALLDRLENDRVQDIVVMFGFAWANSVYPGQWEDIRCTPAEARERVLKAEREKLGAIGADDFYVTLPKEGLEWQYCHEADIHLSCDEPHPMLSRMKEEWTTKGWEVFG